jgi:hypothetical protein
MSGDQWRTQEFCSGGGGVLGGFVFVFLFALCGRCGGGGGGGGGGEFQQIHLRAEDRENGDLGAVAP